MGEVAPTQVVDRIEVLDVLRGVAVCGILLMNIPEMGLIGMPPRPAYPAAWNADWIAYVVQSVLFSGTMRGLFTMLFGAGMLLMLRRADGPQPQVTPIDVWTRRCLALLALGVVNFLLLMWPGEILWNYGMAGFALLAFRTWRARNLLLAAMLCLAAMTVVDGVQSYQGAVQLKASVPALRARAAGTPLTPAQQEAVKPYDTARDTLHVPAAKRAAEYRDRTHLPSLIGWSWNLWWSNNLSALSWQILLESLCFMLFGMALFRTGILTGQAPRASYLWLVGVGYLGGLALRGVNTWLAARIGFDIDPVNEAVLATTFRAYGNYEVARLLVTLGHLGLVVLLFRSGILGRATALRALGRMALTTYMAQSLLTSVLFYGAGLLDTFGFAALMATAAAIWVVTGAFCRWWLARHAMGPVEHLLRTVTYDSFGALWRRRQATSTLAVTPSL